jgi:hypothetical protein
VKRPWERSEMRTTWTIFVDAWCQTFNTSRTAAHAIMLTACFLVLVFVLQTWFIWATLIGSAVVAMGLLLAMEYLLRCYFCFCSAGPRTTRINRLRTRQGAAAQRLSSPCSNAEGRISQSGEEFADAAVMAAAILDSARIQPALSGRWPGWLRFPAVCRAFPKLGRVARILGGNLAL